MKSSLVISHVSMELHSNVLEIVLSSLGLSLTVMLQEDTMSEILVCDSILTCLTTHEDFIAFSCCGSAESCIILKCIRRLSVEQGPDPKYGVGCCFLETITSLF